MSWSSGLTASGRIRPPRGGGSRRIVGFRRAHRQCDPSVNAPPPSIAATASWRDPRKGC